MKSEEGRNERALTKIFSGIYPVHPLPWASSAGKKLGKKKGKARSPATKNGPESSLGAVV